MKVRTAKNIQTACFALALLLFLINAVMPNVVLIVIGVIIAIAGWSIWLIFGRCKRCGKLVGKYLCEHCPHCGEKIESGDKYE